MSVWSSAERKMEVGEEINSVEQSIGDVDSIFRTQANKATGQKEIVSGITYSTENNSIDLQHGGEASRKSTSYEDPLAIGQTRSSREFPHCHCESDTLPSGQLGGDKESGLFTLGFTDSVEGRCNATMEKFKIYSKLSRHHQQGAGD